MKLKVVGWYEPVHNELCNEIQILKIKPYYEDYLKQQSNLNYCFNNY